MTSRVPLSMLTLVALTLAACAPAANMSATQSAMDAMHAEETTTAMQSMAANETQTAMDSMHAMETESAMETMHATETQTAMEMMSSETETAMHAEETQTAMGDMMTMSTGMFMPVEHQGAGTATIVGSMDSGYHLELTGFRVDEGPDLHVVLTSTAMVDPSVSSLADAVDLGLLSATEGDLTISIPADADLSRVAAVVIWCEQYSVPFTYAPLATP